MTLSHVATMSPYNRNPTAEHVFVFKHEVKQLRSQASIDILPEITFTARELPS